MNQKSHLGTAFRKAREARGLGVRELARLADTDPSYISHIESGERVPTLRTLVRFADLLHVVAADLAINAIADIKRRGQRP